MLKTDRNTFDQHRNKDCFGKRVVLKDGSPGPFRFVPYSNVKATFQQLACGLRVLGLKPVRSKLAGICPHHQQHDHMGIYAKNRPEWGLALLAGLHQNITLVPLYDTLGPDATQYIIGHAELKTILCSGENLPKVSTKGAHLTFTTVTLFRPNFLTTYNLLWQYPNRCFQRSWKARC